MIFLVHYDPSGGGRLVRLIEFDECERDLAAAERLRIEIELLASGNRMEVVTLEASSIDELRHSHSRYFKSLGQMTKDADAKTESAKSSNSSQKGKN
jgi:hypothetical protein